LNVANELEEDHAEIDAYADESTEGGYDFNLGTLVCLPKTPTGEDVELGVYHAPADTRPLSIVNCDNRLVASAMVSRWEIHISRFVSLRQQGFLKGRSILKNLLEVDDAMAFGTLNEEAAAAVFLDFSAAFPSISQEYVQACLRHLGIPDSALNSFSNLYSRSRCRISIPGKSYDGFALQSGVRQGCPMSPIIYALVAEVLLDILQSIDSDLLLRAYADDTAIVVRNLYETGPKLAEAFHDFEQVSGLKLNLRKSIIVALSNDDNTDITRRKNLAIPRWADMPVQTFCKYLGFYLGPGKKDKSWLAPMNKFRERVKMWAGQPLGLYWNTRVFNTFCLPVLSYVAQLESPPQWVVLEVEALMRKLAPGPTGCASIKDLQLLDDTF